MAIDPKKYKDELKSKGIDPDGERAPKFPRLTATGRYRMAVVGWEFFKSASKGTRGLMIRTVVLSGEHAGKILDTDIWLTGKYQSLLDLFLAHGFEEPFEETDDNVINEIVDKITQNKAFTGTVQSEQYEAKGETRTKYSIRFWGKASGAISKSEQDSMDAGLSSWDDYIDYRSKNPRPAPGTAASRPAAPAQTQRTSEAPFGADEDIPF